MIAAADRDALGWERLWYGIAAAMAVFLAFMFFGIFITYKIVNRLLD